MPLSIMTNVASLTAQRNLARTQDRLAQNVGRLSSGLRINRAGDDAAGLGISSKLGAQIKGISQAQRNANDAVSMLQTSEGGLNEIVNLLSRNRELAVQAANDGTLGATERGYLDAEFQENLNEIGRIAAVTEYNGQKLLDGSVTAKEFQVGIMDSANDRIAVTIGAVDVAGLGLTGVALSDATASQGALTTIDAAIVTLSGVRGDIGAAENRLSSTIGNLGSMYENLSAANSRILDVDVAEETASFSRNQILMQAGVSVLAQANQLPSVALSLLK